MFLSADACRDSTIETCPCSFPAKSDPYAIGWGQKRFAGTLQMVKMERLQWREALLLLCRGEAQLTV